MNFSNKMVVHMDFIRKFNSVLVGIQGLVIHTGFLSHGWTRLRAFPCYFTAENTQLDLKTVYIMYRDELKGLYVVARSLFLLLRTCSALPCLGPAWQDLHTFLPISVQGRGKTATKGRNVTIYS